MASFLDNLFGSDKKTKNKNNFNAVDIDSITNSDDINIIGRQADYYNYALNLGQIPQDDINTINTYRKLAIAPEVDQYLNEIFNETFIFDVENKRAFDIKWYSDESKNVNVALQKKIAAEVENIYEILDFTANGRDLFAKFYIDGRIKFQIAVDEKKLKDGIKKILTIDPLKLRKVRLIPEPDRLNGTYNIGEIKSYYIYNNTFNTKYSNINTFYDVTNISQIGGVKISEQAVVEATSGLKDLVTDRTIGWLHKSIVPYNNLKMMEQAMVIFRVVRAPMRRAFYVDVNGMQPSKIEKYMRDFKARMSTKPVYNNESGTFNDNTHIQSMVEDYYLPRIEGKTTEIVNIDGQSDQQILEEVAYFRDKLQKSMNVPGSRFDEQQQSTFIYGKSTEILRDEYRFKKFINYCRARFMMSIDEILKRQLILKNIITEDEWDMVKGEYYWEFAEDNAFVEFKEAEILNNKLDQLERIMPFRNIFFSDEWIKEFVLKQSEEEIDVIADQIEDWKKKNPQPDENGGMPQ